MLLQEGVQRQHEKALACKMGLGEGMRVTFDILESLMSPPRASGTRPARSSASASCTPSGVRTGGLCRCGAQGALLHRLLE
eukprot:7752323-Pyramimonas_sp.AAC.1